MKSIQDLCIWLNKVEQALEVSAIDQVYSIEIFSDKSFRVNKHNNINVVTVYDSEESPIKEDINDLPYHDPDIFAEEIKETIEDKKEESRIIKKFNL